MPSRSVLFLAAAALALAPAALAQTAQTLTIEIQDLPAAAESNGTLLAVPFQVRATIGGASPCLSTTGGTQYTIDLDAEVTNSTGNSTRAQVSPQQITIAGPVLLPAGGDGSAERTETVTLLVYPGPYAGEGLNATVHVTASFAGGNPGCTGGAATPPASDEADLRAGFLPPQGFGEPESDGQEMPSIGALLMLGVLGAVALALRRRT